MRMTEAYRRSRTGDEPITPAGTQITSPTPEPPRAGRLGLDSRIRGDTLRKRASLVGIAGLAGLAIVAVLAAPGRAADPAVRPAVTAALADDAMAQIADVYAWMESSQILNVVMDVSPGDDGSHSFGPGVTYVLHLTSRASPDIATTADLETRVICQFTANTRVQCWVTDPTSPTSAKPYKAYLAGDPSKPTGVETSDHLLKVFAGRRADPQFFNTTGFATAVAHYKALAMGQMADAAGCPSWLTATQANSLLTDLGTGADTFAAANVMAIVVQIDTSLIKTNDNATITVWGATHAAP
jgi:uncharacterized protein DUF4331